MIDIETFMEPAFLLNYNLDYISSNSSFKLIFQEKDIHTEILDLIADNTNRNIQEFILFKINEHDYIFHMYRFNDEQYILVIIFESTIIEPVVNSLSSTQTMKDEFFDMLSVLHDDFVIIDKNGIITSALPNFEALYGISKEKAIGMTIFELEEKKIFNPSVAIRVFKSGSPETIMQRTGTGKYLMCTAIPIKDKDGNIEKIVSYTRDLTKYQRLKEEYENLEENLKFYSEEINRLRKDKELPTSVVGNGTVVKNIYSTITKIADFDATVLFLGESGVGKTMFAELMHSQSIRKSGPFIEINCGAIPENLLESELFGYEKGAFSGAKNEGKPGLIELSNNGTLFLDEMGDLPLHMQVKLLKCIQQKKILRIGGASMKDVDFRLISATNKDLENLVKEGKFREDLFYRLNVITINIPSLRERKEDIFYLANHFIKEIGIKYGIKRTLSNTVIDYLIEYDWPGNIRELENLIERLVLTSDDYMITEENLPTKMKTNIFQTPGKGDSLKDILENVERRIIIDSYKRLGTSTGVAAELNISQPSASNKINKYISSIKAH